MFCHTLFSLSNDFLCLLNVELKIKEVDPFFFNSIDVDCSTLHGPGYAVGAINGLALNRAQKAGYQLSAAVLKGLKGKVSSH